MGQGLSLWKELLGIPEIKIVGKNDKQRVVANSAAIRDLTMKRLSREYQEKCRRWFMSSDPHHQPKVPR